MIVDDYYTQNYFLEAFHYQLELFLFVYLSLVTDMFVFMAVQIYVHSVGVSFIDKHERKQSSFVKASGQQLRKHM